MTRFRTFLHHGLSIAVAALFTLIFVWVVSMSLRVSGQPPSPVIEWLPSPLTLNNYQRIFTLVPLGRYLLNSILVVGLAVPITLVTASWAGFAMAQMGRLWRNALVLLAVLLLMIPVTALWLTRYFIFTRLGISDSVLALIAPALMGSSPLFVLLFYWSFRRVPREMFEAAQLDGAGAFGVWLDVAMPVVRPTIAAVGVLTFVMYWSDFINPLLYLKSESRYTLAMGLRSLQQLDKTNWPLLMAASVVMTAPTVLMFLTVQRYFWSVGRLLSVRGNDVS